VEHRTIVIVKTRNFPQPCNTTLQHEFYLATSQWHKYWNTGIRPHNAYPHVFHMDL